MNYPNKQHDISLIYQARLSIADIKKKKNPENTSIARLQRWKQSKLRLETLFVYAF